MITFLALYPLHTFRYHDQTPASIFPKDDGEVLVRYKPKQRLSDQPKMLSKVAQEF